MFQRRIGWFRGISIEGIYRETVRRYPCPRCGTRMKPITKGKKGRFTSRGEKQYQIDWRWYNHAHIVFDWKRWKCPACGRRMTTKKLEQIKIDKIGREAYERRKKILTIFFNVIWISAAAIWLYLQYKKTIG